MVFSGITARSIRQKTSFYPSSYYHRLKEKVTQKIPLHLIFEALELTRVKMHLNIKNFHWTKIL